MLHYLKAVEALKSDATGDKVVAKMKELPTDDPVFGKGRVRQDGRKIHDMYLFEVKKPVGIEGAVGLLQAARHHPRRAGVPAGEGRRLPAGQVTSEDERRESRETVSAASSSPFTRHLHPDRSVSEIFGIPTQALFGQLLIGLINGSFYALLSLGLAVIFGLLNIINFTHGAQYMMGAFCAWFLLNKLGLNYWWALVARADRRRARPAS